MADFQSCMAFYGCQPDNIMAKIRQFSGHNRQFLEEKIHKHIGHIKVGVTSQIPRQWSVRRKNLARDRLLPCPVNLDNLYKHTGRRTEGLEKNIHQASFDHVKDGLMPFLAFCNL